MCKWVAGCPPPNPLRFFQRQKCLLRQEGKLPAFSSRENMHTKASSTQEEEPHKNDLGGLKAKKMSLAIHRTFRPARHVERVQGVQMGAGCPLQPLRFLQRQTSRPQEANIESHVFSDRSAAVPEASTQERDCHTRTLQELSPNGFRVNSNNLRLGSRQPHL